MTEARNDSVRKLKVTPVGVVVVGAGEGRRKDRSRKKGEPILSSV